MRKQSRTEGKQESRKSEKQESRKGGKQEKKKAHQSRVNHGGETSKKQTITRPRKIDS